MLDSKPRQWSKESIEQFLRNEKPGYQRIELPYGLATKGHDRQQLKDLALGDVEGKTVLDIGSLSGAFCIEALRRGASRAVGIELSRKRIHWAKTIADILGLSPEYIRGNIESIDFDQKFDIVLCLNMLHHLLNPIGVIRTLSEVARERLVIELASLGVRDRQHGLGLIARHFLKRNPTLFVGRYDLEGLRQTYFFSIEGIKCILESHMRKFHRVSYFKSEFKNRYIIIADKLKIGRIVLISGLTSSGKSTFREKFLCGEFGSDIERVSEGVVQTGANGITRRRMDDIFPCQKTDCMIYHYDLTRKENLNTHSYDRDVACDVISTAEKIDLITVCPPLSMLQRQLYEGEIASAKAKTMLRKYRKLMERYKDPQWVNNMYCDWIEFCASLKVRELRIYVYMGNDRKLVSVSSAQEAKSIINEIYLS